MAEPRATPPGPQPWGLRTFRGVTAQLDPVIAYLCEVARLELSALWGCALAMRQTLPAAVEAFRRVEVEQALVAEATSAGYLCGARQGRAFRHASLSSGASHRAADRVNSTEAIKSRARMMGHVC